MKKLTPFLWFDSNAEDAANFYLSIFPDAKKITEVRSKGVGPWPAGSIATITIELLGQQMIFLNGGPAHKLNEAFSWSIACKDQQEIDTFWSALTPGGKEVACGWLQDKFGVFWQVVPENIGELISHPKGMEAMMKMVKLDIATLEAAGKP
jgi:predicted 3-demethylubiquinone-9 3-methyltransferase (glyoxalase superfamily)